MAEPDKMSGSLRAMDDEVLASEFKRRYDAVGKRLKELRPLCVELRKRFFNLSRVDDGGTIMGCKTWTEFCEKHLKYSDRHVRRLIEGENPATEKHGPKPERKPGAASGGAAKTCGKDDAVRRIVAWTLSFIKPFSPIEKRQIVEEVLAKLWQTTLATERRQTHFKRSPSRISPTRSAQGH